MDLIALGKFISKNSTTDSVINLAFADANKDVLKSFCEIFKKSIAKILEGEFLDEVTMLKYGPATGSDEWKDQVSHFLSQAHGNPVLRDNLVQTCGAHHGMHLVLTTLLDMNGVVFIDELTYVLNSSVIKHFSSMQIIPVAFDSTTGLDFEDLRRKVIEKRFTPCKGKLFWGVYYTMTVFHNPSGITFSKDLCRKLVEMARQEDLLIASDDASNLLSYDEKPPKRLFAYDDPRDENFQGNVVSLGTFSKIISSGIRIGWMECPQRITSEFENSFLLNATGASNQFTSSLVSNLIREGLLQQHYKKVKLINQERLNFFYDYLKEKLPEVEVRNSGGGCFLWVKFPKAFPVDTFINFLAHEHQIYITHGSTYSTNPQKFNNFCRIICTYHELPTIKVASEKFCNTFGKFA